MDHHELPVHEVVLLLETDADDGLSKSEAADRLERFGPNVLPHIGRHGPLLRFLLQFHHPLLYVLLAAGATTALLGEVVDASVIMAVVVINAIIGFLQESRAERALEALVAMVQTQATVVRGGEKRRLPSVEIVPGDLILLEAGDKVPADLRLLTVRDLLAEVAAMTEPFGSLGGGFMARHYPQPTTIGLTSRFQDVTSRRFLACPAPERAR